MNVAVYIASLPLRLKLALGLVVAVILAIGLSLFAAAQYNNAVLPIEGTVVETLASERAISLSSVLNDSALSIQQLARDTQLAGYLTALANDPNNAAARVQIRNRFQTFLDIFPTFLQLRFVSPTGEVLTIMPPTASGGNDSEQAYYKALKGKSPTESPEDAYIGPIGDPLNPTFEVAVVPGLGDQAIGYLAASVDAKGTSAPYSSSVYGTLRVVAPSTGAVVFYLVDSDGNIRSPIQPVTPTKDTADSALALTRQPFTAPRVYTSPLSGTLALGYGVPINRLKMTLVAEVRQAQIGSAETGSFVLRLLLILGVGFAVLALIALYLERTVDGPIRRLARIAPDVAQGRIPDTIEPLRQRDELGSLYHAFGMLTARLRQDVRGLEVRVSRRTRDVEATRDIGQAISSIHDLDTLLREVTELIRQRFENIYHAQVFLLDAQGEYAMLRVSTGEVGQKLLARGHRLAVGSQSVIGHVTAEGQPVVALDTSTSTIHKANELLPDTRAELALPLRATEGVIGALDLQSKQVDAFSEADISLFQNIADQLAVAITNARLFEELQTRVVEIEALNRQLVGEAWRGYARSRRGALPAASTGNGVSDSWSELQSQAVKTGKVVEHIDETTVTFAVPISLRGEVLGAVEWDIPRGAYNEDVRQLAQELASRLAISADNARLFDQAQRVAEREALVNAIANKLTQQTNIARILWVAAREVGQALRVPHTSIRLAASQSEEVDTKLR